MISPILAGSDLSDSADWRAGFFWQHFEVIWPFIGVILVVFTIFALAVSSIWLVRTVRRMKRLSQTAFQAIDDPMQQIAEARAHLDASKRHITALEEKLDQIQDQLKRRPHS